MATTVAVSPSEYLQPSTTASQVRAHNIAPMMCVLGRDCVCLPF